MTRRILAAWFGLLMACGSSQPKTHTDTTTTESNGSATEAAACAPADCGPEPPISPSVCPANAKISSECVRAVSGACERKILCDGKNANEAAPPAP